MRLPLGAGAAGMAATEPWWRGNPWESAGMKDFRVDVNMTTSPSQVPFLLPFPFFGRFGSPTKIDYKKKGGLILSSLQEDLVNIKQKQKMCFLELFGECLVLLFRGFFFAVGSLFAVGFSASRRLLSSNNTCTTGFTQGCERNGNHLQNG